MWATYWGIKMAKVNGKVCRGKKHASKKNFNAHSRLARVVTGAVWKGAGKERRRARAILSQQASRSEASQRTMPETPKKRRADRGVRGYVIAVAQRLYP